MQTSTESVFECQTCGAGLNVAPGTRTAKCAFCASPSVVERPAARDRPNPAFAIGFVLARPAIEERLMWWTKNQGFFRRQDLYKGHIEDLKSVYIPAYLFSAAAYSEYSASIGENYQETQTYTVFVNGRAQTRTRTVTKTEWRPLSGRYASYVSDVLVTASRGVSNAELEAIEPYDMRGLARYTPALVSGWPTEEPSVAGAEAAQNARQEAINATSSNLARFMPGDSHQGLTHRTWLDRESFDLVLVPVAVLALRFDAQKPPLRILINGQTGRVLGKAPWSVPRILAVASVIVAIIVGFIILGAVTGDDRRSSRRTQPPATPQTVVAPRPIQPPTATAPPTSPAAPKTSPKTVPTAPKTAPKPGPTAPKTAPPAGPTSPKQNGRGGR